MKRKTLVRSALVLGALAVAIAAYVMSQVGDDGVSAGFPPTETPTITQTPTVTPTKLPFPGDTDGDGCSDQQENGLDEFLGGQRDFTNPYDYFNPSGDGFNRLDDLLGVIEHYAPTGAPPYDVQYDRGEIIGPNAWNSGPPDGVIDLANDILGMIIQYHHDCSTPPLPGPTPPPATGLDFSIGVDTGGLPADDCGTQVGPTTCTVTDYTFTLNVYLNSLPVAISGYTGLNAAVTFGGVLVKDLGLKDWADCQSPIGWTGGNAAATACTSALVPPLANSTYTGLIGTAEFTCLSDGQVSLVHGALDTALFEDAATLFVEGEGTAESLTISCDGPTTTPTATPTATPTPTATNTPCGGPCPTPTNTPMPPGTYVVDSMADLPDANPGDGACATTGGACTLRAAVQEVNANPGSNVIVPQGTYVLSTGQLTITADLDLAGLGPSLTVVDGSNLDRVIAVGLGATVELSGIRVRNGMYSGDGGGISNEGTLTINDLKVDGNWASPGGGGVLNTGTMTINGSEITNNFGWNWGGGVLNKGIMTINDSAITNNADEGVTNRTEGAVLTINNSVISGNKNDWTAGGIGAEYGTTLTINGSTIRDNVGDFYGGVYNNGTAVINKSSIINNSASNFAGGIDNSNTMTITNSTISGNSIASYSFPGGIANGGEATLTVYNSTITGNDNEGLRNRGLATLKNTIVANNYRDDCESGSTSVAITSSGHNLDSDGTCGFTAAGDISHVNPQLGPLADNGGPTLTHTLLSGSPALDAGSGDCPPPSTDQRGVGRPGDGDGDGTATCDIGAFECPSFDCPLPPTPTPTSTPSPTPTPDPTDSDGDGCTDQRENGLTPALGGLRDYLNPYDFYDVEGFMRGPPDRYVDLATDILPVILHYSPTGTEPEYDAYYDRGPSVGPNPWNMTAPDGVIDLPNDILGVILQYHHDCR